MAHRLIAIGDIHGCDRALRALIDVLDLDCQDTLVTLGDYVDRGRNSRAVIDMLLELETSCRLVPLLGNHEEMMLSVLVDGRSPQRWLQYGGIDTLDSYDFRGDLKVIPEQHIAFLQRCKPYFETERHIFVHANFDPDLPLERQTGWTLRWRILDATPLGGHCSGKTAIVGHTPDLGGDILDLGYLRCLDTYCYGGKWLTAQDIVTKQLWQADNDGNLRCDPRVPVTQSEVYNGSKASESMIVTPR